MDQSFAVILYIVSHRAPGVDYFGLYVLFTHRDRRAISGMCKGIPAEPRGAWGGTSTGDGDVSPGAGEVRNHPSCLGSQSRR